MFSKHNIDEDCDTIVRLLSPYRKAVYESLSQGNFDEAVTISCSKALRTTLWKNEHYNCFDDMYSPNYVCQNMMKAVIGSIKSGKFPNKELQGLKNGMAKLKHT